ncbi:hypothetical protein JOM56_011513 [Amanita muscaria]
MARNCYKVMAASSMTRFQELLLISFREFSVITDEMIVNERKWFGNEIIRNIESSSKRAVIRNLKSLERRCASLFTTNGGREEKYETIRLRTFRYFLSEIATWARDEKVVLTDFVSELDRDGVMFNDLMENIEWFFNLHDKDKDGHSDGRGVDPL